MQTQKSRVGPLSSPLLSSSKVFTFFQPPKVKLKLAAIEREREREKVIVEKYAPVLANCRRKNIILLLVVVVTVAVKNP